MSVLHVCVRVCVCAACGWCPALTACAPPSLPPQLMPTELEARINMQVGVCGGRPRLTCPPLICTSGPQGSAERSRAQPPMPTGRERCSKPPPPASTRPSATERRYLAAPGSAGKATSYSPQVEPYTFFLPQTHRGTLTRKLIPAAAPGGAAPCSAHQGGGQLLHAAAALHAARTRDPQAEGRAGMGGEGGGGAGQVLLSPALLFSGAHAHTHARTHSRTRTHTRTRRRGKRTSHSCTRRWGPVCVCMNSEVGLPWGCGAWVLCVWAFVAREMKVRKETRGWGSPLLSDHPSPPTSLQVSIGFVDIVGFTSMSAKWPSSKVAQVRRLGACVPPPGSLPRAWRPGQAGCPAKLGAGPPRGHACQATRHGKLLLPRPRSRCCSLCCTHPHADAQ